MSIKTVSKQEYMVRVWMDFKVLANNEIEARELVDKHPINSRDTKTIELYDGQIAKVWVLDKEE